MIHQHNPQRYKIHQFGGKSGSKRVGTVPVGTILYIQAGITPLRGLPRDPVRREPWIVEAWVPRDYPKWAADQGQFRLVRINGGHLAQVRSLRDRRRVQLVADWILLHCLDAGLEKLA